jgi:hypothetical protein
MGSINAHTFIENLIPDWSNNTFISVFRDMETQQLDCGQVKWNCISLVKLWQSEFELPPKCLLRTSVIVNKRLESNWIRSLTSTASSTCGRRVLYISSCTWATSNFSSRSVRKAIAVSCLPVADMGWDLAFATASVRYSSRASRSRSNLNQTR